MTSLNDCWFFYNSTCAKGDDCPFRHEPLAMGKPICDLWSAGSCNRNPCRFRHSNVELVRSTAQCYYENQPTGCLNSSCQFTHSKARPLLTNFSAVSLPTQPILNVPLRSRFPPNSQMFGGSMFTSVSMTSAPRQAMQTLLRNHPPPHPVRGLSPAVIPNNSFQIVRPNLFNQNHPSLRLTNPLSATRPNPVKPLMKCPGETPISLPHPRMRGNTSKTQAMPSLADLIRPSTGDGLLPLPSTPVLPFSLGGLFARNIVSAARVSNKQKTRSSAKASNKRTVKKYEGIRNRKNDKQSKRRNDKKKPQDSNIEKKKKKRDSNKDEKGKNRKMKQSNSASKSKKSIGVHHSEAQTDVTSVDVIDKNEEDEEDTYEEINLGFKVKTLEEILRDKALRKFLERQNNKNATKDGKSEDEITVGLKSGTSSSESVDADVVKTYAIDSIDDVRPDDKTNQIKTSNPNIKKLKPLKPLKPLRDTKRSKLVENITGKTEQNQCSDQKKPLPPLKRLKPLSKTVRKEGSTDKALKRKLQASPDDSQTALRKKLLKIETVMVDDTSPSSVGVRKLVDAGMKTEDETLSEDVESLNKQDITSMNVDKSQNKPKRTIVVLQSRARFKPAGAKTTQDNVQQLRNRDKTKLAQPPEQNEVNEEKTSQNVEDNNSKKDKIEPQNVLFKDLLPNVERKPPGKVIKLNLSKDAKNVPLRKDFQLSVNSKSFKPGNNVAKRIESSAILGITATNNAAERKQVLNQVINPDADIKADDNDTAALSSKEPTKMIKLNRNRLTVKKRDGRNYEGKRRIQFSSLGRIIKMNAKAVTSKQAVVKPVSAQSAELFKQENTSNVEINNSNSIVKEETEVKSTDTSQNTNAPVNLNDMPTCGETKSTSNDKGCKANKKQLQKAIVKPTCSTVTKLQASSNLSHKEQAVECSEFAMINSGTQNNDIQDQHAAQEELNIPVTKLKEASARPNIEDVPMLSRKIFRKERELDPETHKLEKISPEEQTQDSLDRLFEEVSEDVEDEGEDFLNEALEKAIAELSPVNTDDEEDVSNADDLLLEIEEMII